MAHLDFLAVAWMEFRPTRGHTPRTTGGVHGRKFLSRPPARGDSRRFLVCSNVVEAWIGCAPTTGRRRIDHKLVSACWLRAVPPLPSASDAHVAPIEAPGRLAAAKWNPAAGQLGRGRGGVRR